MIAFIEQWWKWMTSRPGDDRSLLGTIAWWERQRFSYNIFLAGFGVVGLLLFFVALRAGHSLAAGEDAVEPIALLAAPIAANIAYTAGWVVEGALLAYEPARPFGPRLMRAGLLFSLAVIFAPGLLWAVVALAGWLLHLSRPGEI